LAEAADLALNLTRSHPNIEYLPSYAAGAYYDRVALLLRNDPDNVARARQLAEELESRLPGYRRGMMDYPRIIAAIERREKTPATRRVRLK